MAYEGENALEAVEEIVEKCVKCGLCKLDCPVFKATKEEIMSPRGKAIFLQNKLYDSVMYNCTLCKKCELSCPLKVKLCHAFKEARKALVDKGLSSEKNKEMIERVRKFGNPFGKEGDKIESLYCC